MANSLYDYGRASFAYGAISWASSTFKVALVSSAYSVDLAAHQYRAALSGVLTGGLSSALAGKGILSTGVADADDVSMTGVTGSCKAIVIYQDTGDAATDRLIAYIDVGTGLPANNLSSASVTISWAETSARLFKL